MHILDLTGADLLTDKQWTHLDAVRRRPAPGGGDDLGVSTRQWSAPTATSTGPAANQVAQAHRYPGHRRAGCSARGPHARPDVEATASRRPGLLRPAGHSNGPTEAINRTVIRGSWLTLIELFGSLAASRRLSVWLVPEASLSETEGRGAVVASVEARLAVLDPHLHEGVPLAEAARRAGVPRRTATRLLAA